MNTKMKFLAAPALALLAGAGLWGQATKIAVIDMQRAIAETKDGQAQIAEMQKKYGPKEQEFQRRAADIQAKQDQLRKTQNTMSDDAKASAAAEIQKLQSTLQRDSDDAQADSQADEQRVVQDLGNKVVQVVGKYAQENQIMAVFDTSGQPNNLICCASANDITTAVIAAYDKANPVSGAAAAPPAAKPATPAAAPRPAAPAAPKPAAPAK